MFESIVKRELRKTTVFKDEGKLSFDYIPPHLPHREDEIRMLTQAFRPVIKNPGRFSPTAIVRGKIGTGKTVLTKRFGSDFERYALAHKINFKYIHVNCREEGSFYNILKNIILQHFEKTFPHRGFSSQELLNILTGILDKKNFHIIITLDELEALIRKEGSEPLFNLTRLYEDKPPNTLKRFSLICIFREPECEEAYKLLDRSTLSTIGFNTIRLEKYNSVQLKDILEYRVKEAFKENTVLSDTVDLIADLGGNYGDARFAIELLWLAGKSADKEGLPKVRPEHVRVAQTYAHPSLKIEDLRATELHEKFLMLATARLLKNSSSAYLPIGEIEKEYHLICEEFTETPREHTQIWKYIKNLSITGLISTKISGEGQRGKTTMVGLYVPSEKLEKELLKMLR